MPASSSPTPGDREAAGARDERFLALVTTAADAHATDVVAGLDDLLAGAPHHRTVMAGAKALLACYLHPDSRLHRSERAAGAAARLADHLAATQGEDGLFDGENLSSPPDTAFTVNDLCDTYALLRRGVAPELEPVAKTLEGVALAARESLLHGGVHTPNHRWELCAALARLHGHWPDERLPARVDAWLAEGVDIADDGLYSERSANYAAHVSNPSLVAIAAELDRPELLAAVRRNLDATLATTLPDGTVETVHSRRQDQNAGIAVDTYLMQFRRFALTERRGDYAAVVADILDRPLTDPAGALAAVLLEPWLADPLPSPAPRGPGRTTFPSAGLVVERDGRRYLSVYGGSDYARHARIRSGLANNPTFLRLVRGRAVLDAVRLSRDFFGLGPFRADGLVEEDGELVLRERVAAHYYGPLPAEHRRADGAYPLGDDGRFSASMDFAHRPASEVTLHTELRVRVRGDEVELSCTVSPARVRHTFELTFRPGGELAGTRELPGPGRHALAGDRGGYRCGGDTIEFHVLDPDPPSHPPAYAPGEDYTALSGTDATSGTRVYLAGNRSGRTVLRLRGTAA